MDQVVILAGGQGTRLGSQSLHKPKCLQEIAEIPILEHQLNFFRNSGFSKIHLALGVHSQKIIEYVENHFESEELDFTFSIEQNLLGTGGAVINSLTFLEERFLVIHGDIYINTTIERLVSAISEPTVDFAQLVHPSNHMNDSDLVVIDSNDYIVSYVKKPHIEFTGHRNLCNAGVYAFKRDVFQNLQLKDKTDLDRELLPLLITKGLRGKAIRNFGFIRDAGTPERLREVNSKFKSKLTNSKKKRLALFDRDGTINLSKGYITDFNQIELCVGVGDLIRWLNDNDFYVAVLTNQPVIARGEASFSDVDLIHARIDFLLAEFNAYIDAYFICPHHPHSGFKGEIRDLKMICYCRKPSKGLAEKCFEYFALRPQDSIMIGDSWRDQELASELQVQFFEINERNSEERYEEILGTLQKNFSLE